MTNVSFYADGVLFGQSTASPFSAVWSSVTPGAHLLTAVGLDNSGNSYSSTPVGIAVARVLFASNSVWKYLDDGSDQGTAWTAPAFDDSTWLSGPTTLGYGDPWEATFVNSGPTNQHFITTYLRTSFVVNNAASYSNLIFYVLRDDGAIVHLNGTEAARYNINAGAVDYLTAANLANDDGTTYFPTNAAASLLVEGVNTMAVEVHQEAIT